MKNTLAFEAEPFETYSEFDEEFESGSTDLEWEEEARRISRLPIRRPTISAKLPKRPPYRPPRPPIRPPRPPWRRPRRPVVIYPAWPVPVGAGPEAPQPGTEFVRWVQHSLNLILGLRLPVDGAMNPETREAIRDFQTRMGLLADGIVGPETQQALVDERQKLAAGGAPSQEQTEFLPAAEFLLTEQPHREFDESELEFSLSPFPATVQEALRNRREGVAVKLAIAYGYRDENQLTNLVFFARHPERGGKALSQSEANFQQLSREWISIRDSVVRPALRGGTATPPLGGAVPSGGISPGAPDIVSVRGIRVARKIAPQVEALLAAAEADGIRLSGGGYRSSAAQIELRRKHCGPSRYDIWEKPSSQCKPPTARPGRSNHEKGLAIDFTYNGATIKSRDNPGFRWLAANAARFGLYNLPSEPWHWSVDGN